MEGTAQRRQVDLIDLNREVQELRERVARLEQRVGMEAVVQDPVAIAGFPGPELALPNVEAGRLLPLAGITLVALAGAYLLRAFSEMKVLPIGAGVGIGIVYALVWLVLAARAPGSDALTPAIRSLTAGLILMPLLWEAQVRFAATSTGVNAGVLVVFVAFGLVVSWRRNLNAIAWIVSLAGLATLLALMLASYDLLPFTCALLAMTLVTEACACLDHWMGERWIVAVMADLAVLYMTWVTTRSSGLPQGYVPIAAAAVLMVQIGLLAISIAGTVVRTLWRGRSIGAFEIMQCAAAFLLAALGGVRVAAGQPAAILWVGSCAAVLGAACYLISFAFLARHSGTDRNFYAYATFGLALALLGSGVLLRGTLAVAFWSLAAMALLWAGQSSGRSTLVWHSLGAMALAGTASGLFTRAFGEYWLLPPAASAASLAQWIAGVAVVTATVAAAVWLKERIPTGILMLAGAWSTASLAGAVLLWLLPEAVAPTALTAALIALAWALGWASRRSGRSEISWAMWLVLALASGKLLLQDVRLNHTLALVISLGLYGATLAWLPRWISRGGTRTLET